MNNLDHLRALYDGLLKIFSENHPPESIALGSITAALTQASQAVESVAGMDKEQILLVSQVYADLAETFQSMIIFELESQ